jgi:nicotinamidase-related amidase
LIIDIVNAFDYPGGDSLLKETRRALPAIVRLKARASKVASPIVYCNDNFGQWRSDFKAVVAHCTGDDMPGRDVVRRIKPDEDDYFILKPKHSAFYQTPLESLLEYLEVRRVILAGIAGDSCIHSTATDAHIREFDVVVCADATASQTRARNRNALQHLETAEYARLASSASVRF